MNWTALVTAKKDNMVAQISFILVWTLSDTVTTTYSMSLIHNSVHNDDVGAFIEQKMLQFDWLQQLSSLKSGDLSRDHT